MSNPASSLAMLSEETRALVYDMITKAQNGPALRKTIDTTTGLVGVNLEAAAKQLVPLLADFRNSIPRSVKDGATASKWKAITALSQPRFSVAESAAGATFTTTASEKTASYKIHALRGQVTREAVAASNGFEPALAKETANTLLLAMKLEEMTILGGNITALATPGAPTVTERDATGTIVNAAHFARIAALTLPAANRLTIQRPLDYDGTDAKLAGVATAVVDVGTDGVTVAGAEGTVTTTGTDNALKITWAPVLGAAAYAVYVGTTTGAANLKCEAIVTQCSVTLTSLAATGQAASALTGTSADALTYDGMIAQIIANGGYTKNVAGKLTGTSGEILELQDAFATLYDAAKIAVFRVLVGGQDARIVSRLGYNQDAARVVVTGDESARAGYIAGIHVSQIMNATTGMACPVETLPWIPGGMVILVPTEIPYVDANTPSAFDLAMGYDWERWDYASTSSTGPVFPFETRCYGALRALVPGGCGVIYNIFKG